MSKIITIFIDTKRAPSGLEDENGSFQGKSVGLCGALTVTLGSVVMVNIKKQMMTKQGKGKRNQIRTAPVLMRRQYVSYTVYTIGHLSVFSF